MTNRFMWAALAGVCAAIAPGVESFVAAVSPQPSRPVSVAAASAGATGTVRS